MWCGILIKIVTLNFIIKMTFEKRIEGVERIRNSDIQATMHIPREGPKKGLSLLEHQQETSMVQ